jgi:pseudouridine-5'-phosphate glycosidase
VTGKAVTPFVLAAIKDETQGQSLTANVALVKHNATIGAQIAVALSHGIQMV